MSKHPAMVEYNGQEMTLYAATKASGISETCLKKRYARGDRGEKLFRPTGRRRKAEGTAETRAEQEAAEQASVARKETHRERAARIRMEHAAAFSAPLIDDKLLTDAERLRIRERVNGRQRWNSGWFGETSDTREAGR